MTVKHFAGHFVTTAVDDTWIGFLVETSKDHKNITAYYHQKGNVYGFVTSIEPTTFLYEYDNADEGDVLSFGEIRVSKGELPFLKKLVLDALEEF